MTEPNGQDAPSSKSREETPANNPPTPSPQDLRKHLRFRIDDSSTSFSIKGVSTSLGLGKANRGRAAINLSEGGMMLLVCEVIPIGTKIIVRIEMDEYPDFIEVGGVVRWCEQDERNEKDFHAGIQFADLSDSDVRKIAKMREWLGSSEYQSRRANKPRE